MYGHLLILLAIFTIIVMEYCKCATELHLLKCGLTCKEPQPRAVRVTQLINTTNDVIPYMTIIHRCDEGSGCCKQKGLICKVAKLNLIDVKVLLFIQNKYKYSIHTVKNHTECSCQTIDNVIK